MTKNSVESIKNIIESLNQQEKDTIRTYIASFNRKYGEYNPKTLQLFDAISDNTKIISVKALRQLFSSETENTFQKLCARLKEKIYEGLILDINLKRSKRYSPAIFTLYQVRKNLITMQVLYSRGLTEDALSLINKSASIAAENHYYNELFTFLNYKHNIIQFRYGHKQGRKVQKEMEYFTNLRTIHEKAEILYNSFAYRERRVGNAASYLNEMKTKIDELACEDFLQEVDVAQYYLAQLKNMYERIRGNYPEMEKNALFLRELLQKYPRLQTRPRIANVLINLADANLYNGNYDNARKFAQEVREMVVPNSANFFEHELFFFFIDFYQGNYHASSEHARQLLKISENQSFNDEFYRDKVRYFQAYALMMQKKYQAANRMLMQVHELANDREGWNIGFRILQILVRIGQKEFGKADILIDSLVNYSSAKERKKMLKERDRRNILLLSKLMRSDYVYNSVKIKNTALIKSLASAPVKWQYGTPELIPVNEWLAETLAG